LTEEERQFMARQGLNARHIAWRRKNRSTLRGLSPQEFAEDPRSCFLASGECVFDLEQVTQRMEGCIKPLDERGQSAFAHLVAAAGEATIYCWCRSGRRWYGGDYSAVQVIDRETAMQCAELQAHFPPRELARRVVELAKAYNQALVVVERNNHGHAVLAYLCETERYKNLFEQDGQLGCLTSAVSRPAMIENLAAVIASAPHLFQSRRLLGRMQDVRAAGKWHDVSLSGRP